LARMTTTIDAVANKKRQTKSPSSFQLLLDPGLLNWNREIRPYGLASARPRCLGRRPGVSRTRPQPPAHVLPPAGSFASGHTRATGFEPCSDRLIQVEAL
jgi:hypothetical protein